VSWATPAHANGIDQAQIDEATQLWQTSAHALNEINCSSCHEASETKEFVAQPGLSHLRLADVIQWDHETTDTRLVLAPLKI